VLTQIREPNAHFSPFYEDNSILIQFILEEFIHVHQSILQIKKLLQQSIDSTEPLPPLSLSLIQIFEKLVGSPPHQERSSLSRWTRGSLTKFKEYSEHFSRNSSYRNKQHVNLHLAAHHAWLRAIYNLEILNSLYSNPYIPNSHSPLFFASLNAFLSAFRNAIQSNGSDYSTHFK